MSAHEREHEQSDFESRSRAAWVTATQHSLRVVLAVALVYFSAAPSLTLSPELPSPRSDGDALTSAVAPPLVPVGPEHALPDAALQAAGAAALAAWQAAGATGDLSGVTFTVADLPDLALG